MTDRHEGARFVLCACKRHGRLIGRPGTVPIEGGRFKTANALVEDAERYGEFAPGGHAQGKSGRVE